MDGSLAPAATRVKIACRSVVALLSTRTWVQPAGGVMVGAPRVVTAATSTSPACTPAGEATAVLVVVPVAVAEPTNVPPVSTPALCVVTVAGAEAGDTFPAASTAVTVYEYEVAAVSPVSVNVVPVVVPTWTPLRDTR